MLRIQSKKIQKHQKQSKRKKIQKYNNQRIFPCIFEKKTISEQIDLILAHCAALVSYTNNLDKLNSLDKC